MSKERLQALRDRVDSVAPIPTAEQEEAIQNFLSGDPLKIVAFAGAGKTSTLRMMSDATPRRGLYVAFNKKTAQEAETKFPDRVKCKTLHALAFGPMVKRFPTEQMTNSINGRTVAKELELSRMVGFSLAAIGKIVLDTVRRFRYSTDNEIDGDYHFPCYGKIGSLDDDDRDALQRYAVDAATELWERMIDPRDDIPLDFDGYLKLWVMGRPILKTDYILMDEAQDSNPIALQLLDHQPAQVVFVGDPHQQIYSWRGAIDALKNVRGRASYLTQSFRFGQSVADLAGRILQKLGETRRIQGNPRLESTWDFEPALNCPVVICRTNAKMIEQFIGVLDGGLRPFVVGGVRDMETELKNVQALQNGREAWCSRLLGFSDWDEVRGFSETEEGQDVRGLVRMVDRYGVAYLLGQLSQATRYEEEADLILTTAHKSKGLEWPEVRLTDDYLTRANSEEVRLAYVAATRGQRSIHLPVDFLTDLEELNLFGAPTGADHHAPEAS